jgi:hypothetical protein
VLNGTLFVQRADHQEHLHVLADPQMPDEDPALATERGEHAAEQRLRAALVPEKRAAVVRLRDSREIDDIVLRRLQRHLDAEEVRLSAPSPEPSPLRGSAPPWRRPPRGGSGWSGQCRACCTRRLSRVMLTVGSPRKPRVRPVVAWVTRLWTWSCVSPVTRATRASCSWA